MIIARPSGWLICNITKITWKPASATSDTMSKRAAYLRYLGVLFLGKGHLRAQVPSKASVSSAMMNKMNTTSGAPPVSARIKIMMAMISLDSVSMSAKYLIF